MPSPVFGWGAIGSYYFGPVNVRRGWLVLVCEDSGCEAAGAGGAGGASSACGGARWGGSFSDGGRGAARCVAPVGERVGARSASWRGRGARGGEAWPAAWGEDCVVCFSAGADRESDLREES